MVWFGIVWYGMVLLCMVWYDMILPCIVRYDTALYGVVWRGIEYEVSRVCPWSAKERHRKTVQL